jgi:UDP-glucose 4-epimerase
MHMGEFGRVLVTGGAGFIGSHLVNRLLKNGADVVVLDNLFSGKMNNIRDHLDAGTFHFVKGDIRDNVFLKKNVVDTDLAVHLAAVVSVPLSVKRPSLAHEVNAAGTLNLLNACLECGAKRVVFASSSAVYGEPEHLPIDENHPTRPISPLATSKLTAEQHCKVFHESYGLETVILRLFNVYGPRQSADDEGAVVARFMKRIRQNLPLIIYGDGKQTRDFVHVNDVVEAFILALTKGNAAGEVFNIGSGTSVTINALAETIRDLAKQNVQTIHQDTRLGDIRHSHAKIERAKKRLGYNPSISLREGLKPFIEHS